MQQMQKEIVHYPTLKTVLAIEEVIKKANTPLSRNQILGKLPTKVMRSTLNFALDYMERRGMVLDTKKGFVWTFNASKKLDGNTKALVEADLVDTQTWLKKQPLLIHMQMDAQSFNMWKWLDQLTDKIHAALGGSPSNHVTAFNTN